MLLNLNLVVTNGFIFGVLLHSHLRRLTSSCKVPVMLTRFSSGFGIHVLEVDINFLAGCYFVTD
jgi:hypothetical protein